MSCHLAFHLWGSAKIKKNLQKFRQQVKRFFEMHQSTAKGVMAVVLLVLQEVSVCVQKVSQRRMCVRAWVCVGSSRQTVMCVL